MLRGGVIYSMDDTASHYSAIAFKNRLTWLGESEAAAAQIGPQTQVIELEGSNGVARFYRHPHSQHGHIALGEWRQAQPLRQPRAGTRENCRACSHASLSESAARLRVPCACFRGRGRRLRSWTRLCPTGPRSSSTRGHTGWANTLALEAAGISRDTPDPVPGAHFSAGREGNPTGWLVESAAIDPVTEALGVISEEALALAAPGFFKEMSAVGLTGADAGMIDTGELGRRLALKLVEAGEFPVRMVAST